MATMKSLPSMLLVLGLAVVACTQEQSVLGLSEVTDCMQAFVAPAGTPCDFDDVCKRPTPVDPMCCSETAYCTPMGLVVDKSCNPDCSMCVDDTGCVPGAAICAMGSCTPCPSTINCPPCPMGWDRLRRNGCETCDCAPVSQCKADPNDPMNPVPQCPAMEQCYPGERCTAGCAPTDDCCANACSAPGCMGPAPIGCLMTCTNNPMCMQCAAEDCECVNGTWQCLERCVDGDFVTASCIAP